MENFAFIHHAVAYEDLSPEPKLRSPKELDFSFFSSVWLTITNALVITGLLSQAAGVQALSSNVKVSTNGGTLYGRTGPGIRHSWAKYYNNGSILSTTGKTRNGWYELTNGLWVAGKWVAPIQEDRTVSAATRSGTVTVSTNGGRLRGRKGPGTQYSWATHYPNGTVLSITGNSQNGWYELTNGLWVSGKWISDKQSPSTTQGEGTDPQPPDVAQPEAEKDIEEIASIPGFAPNIDGFRFSNQELTEALGNNPTLTLPGMETQPTQAPNATEASVEKNQNANKALNLTKNPSAWDDKHWKVVIWWLFGQSTCINQDASSNIACILSAPARRWLKTQVNLLEDGVCEGMAAASLYMWYQRWYQQTYPDAQSLAALVANLTAEEPPPLTDLTTKIKDVIHPETEAFQLEINKEELQKFTAELFILQRLDLVYKPTRETRLIDKPSVILQDVIDSIQAVQNAAEKLNKSQNPNPTSEEFQEFQNKVNALYTIGIYQGQDNELKNGHTLTPFKVTHTNKGKSRVYVYDSNHPGRSDLFIEFDGETWSYFPSGSSDSFDSYTGGEGTNNIDLTKLEFRKLGEGQYFGCTHCNDDSPDGKVDVALDGMGELDVEAIKGFFREGKQEIVPFKGGLNKNIPPFQNLSQGGYEIKIAPERNQSSTDQVQLHILGSNFIVGLQDINLNTYNKVKVYLANLAEGPILVLEADNLESDAILEIPTLLISVTDQSEGESFDFWVSGIHLKKGKSAFVLVNTKDKYFDVGDNDPDTYKRDIYTISTMLNNSSSDAKGELVKDEFDLIQGEFVRVNYGEWQGIQQEEGFKLPLRFGTWEKMPSPAMEVLNSLAEGKTIYVEPQNENPKNGRVPIAEPGGRPPANTTNQGATTNPKTSPSP